jgi:hypothetical protein
MDETSGSMRTVLRDFVGCPANPELDCLSVVTGQLKEAAELSFIPFLSNRVEGAATDFSVVWEHSQLLVSCGEH